MGRQSVYNNFFDEETYKEVNEDNKALLEDFILEFRQLKRSEGTISQYKSDIRIFFIYIYNRLKNKSILELTKKDFRNYSIYLTEECKVSSARHNRMLCSTRSLLTYAENEDEYDYDSNVAKKVHGLGKDPVREIFFLTDEQILKLKEELIKRKEYQKATILMLAYDSAGRRNELTQCEKHSFLDKNKSNTNKVIGKRKKVFSLVYFSGTKECAKLWLEQRGEDNIDSMWIIGSGENKRQAERENIYDWFVYMRELLSVMEKKEIDFNPHSIRHSSLQNFSDGSHYVCRELKMTTGFPIEKLRLLANHENVDTTQGYLKDTSLDELGAMFGIKIE